MGVTWEWVTVLGIIIFIMSLPDSGTTREMRFSNKMSRTREEEELIGNINQNQITSSYLNACFGVNAPRHLSTVLLVRVILAGAGRYVAGLGLQFIAATITCSGTN